MNETNESTKEVAQSNLLTIVREQYDDRGVVLRDMAWLEQEYSDLAEWLQGIKFLGSRYLLITQSKDDPHRARVKIATTDHVYTLSVRDPHTDETGKGYLGCTASTRKPRFGELHTRGNDLADGPYTRDTFVRAMLDIVGYEAQENSLYDYHKE